MYWQIYALLAWFFTGLSFLLLRNVPPNITSNPMNISIYVFSFFIVVGVISAICFLSLKNTSRFNNIINQITTTNKINILGISLSIILGYICLMIAINFGGSPAIQIANLNIIIAIVGGYIFFGDKITRTKIIGILICMFGASILIFS